MSDTAFYSCDFGTSSFRLRRVLANGDVADERREAVGVRDLYARRDPGDADGRAGVFAGFLAEQLRVLGAGDAPGGPPTVVVSGMASSSLGWRELPYASVPFALDGGTARTEAFGLDLGRGEPARVVLVSGLATADDVMRGEETELLGLFADGRYVELAEDGLVILPGTHSKHVTLRGGRVTGFHTYMTGEVFDTLARHTVLRASVGGDRDGASGGLAQPANRTALIMGVRTVAEMGLARSLFKVRARAVLGSADPAANRHFLSGLLIGAEACDLRGSDDVRPVLLAAGPETAEAYRAAFEVLDLGPRLALVAPGEVARAAVRGQAVLLARHVS